MTRRKKTNITVSEVEAAGCRPWRWMGIFHFYGLIDFDYIEKATNIFPVGKLMFIPIP